MKCAHAISIYGMIIGIVSTQVFAQAMPVRSSIESYSIVYLTVVDESDESVQIDDQLDTLAPLGPVTATSTLNSSQGFYTSTVQTAAEFIDAQHGEFESTMNYEGMRAAGDIDAQRFGQSLHGKFEYDFMIPTDGVLNVSGLLSNQGPSPIQFYAVVQVYAEFMQGSGFTGAFFEQQIIDSGFDTEPIDVQVPLNSSSGSYRVRIRLSHSGIGQLDRSLLGGSLSTSWSIESENPCPADLTGDGVLNFFDVSAFLSAYTANDPVADFTDDGVWNFFDVSAFLGAFADGCP